MARGPVPCGVVVAAVVAIAAVVVGAAAGCPDPCVFLGHGCNVNRDCAGGEVCRIARSFEAGCGVVRGTCVSLDAAVADERPDARLCGSVDDCNDNECCDPDTNTCVGEVSYDVSRCDDLTCGSCTDTAAGHRCKSDGDCDKSESCVDEDFNGTSPGVCRQSCDGEGVCPGDERCHATGSASHEVCSVPIGTPCTSPDASGDCLGGTCIDVDENDDHVEPPYCSDFCSTDVGPFCPAGFACVSDQCRARAS